MASKIPDTEWEKHKAQIEDLRLVQKIPCKSIVMEMRKSNFNATEAQYNKQFEKWGWAKNRTAKDWEQFYRVVKSRNLGGRRYEVFIHGRPIPRNEVKRGLARVRIPQHELYSSQPPELPDGFAILPELEGIGLVPLHNLPSEDFESNLSIQPTRLWYVSSSAIRNELPDYTPTITPSLLAPHEDRSMMDFSGSAGADIDESTSMMLEGFASATGELDAVVPFSTQGDQLSCYASSLHRRIIISVANNFAGLERFSTSIIIKYLRQRTPVEFYSMMRNVSSHVSILYVTAIARNMFKAAIEAGDASLLEMLLKNEIGGLDVNEEVCYVNKKCYRPLDRAVALREESVIRVLLEYGAEAHELYHGLDTLVASNRKSEVNDISALTDFNLLEKLLEEHAKIHCGDIISAIQSNEMKNDCIRLLIQARMRTDHQDWSRGRVLCTIFRHCDPEICMETAYLMFETGASLFVAGSVSSYRSLSDDYDAVLDIIVARGNRELTEILIDHGARPTAITLAAAINRGGPKLVSDLLKRGVTPSNRDLSDAIRNQDIEVVQLLINNDVTPTDEDWYKAACCGNTEIVQCFINSGVTPSSDNLRDTLRPRWPVRITQCLIDGGAQPETDHLIRAILVGNDDVFQLLVNNAAPICGQDVYGRTPLGEAIRVKQAQAREMLLEKGAISKHCHNDYLSSVSRAATEAEDLEVVERLRDVGFSFDYNDNGTLLVWAIVRRDHLAAMRSINEGADLERTVRLEGHYSMGSSFGPPLYEALLGRDRRLVDVLLDGGAVPCHRCVSEALYWGDVSVLKDLISAGADVSESSTLTVPIGTGNKEMIEALLKAGTSVNRSLGPALRMAILEGRNALLEAGRWVDGSLASPLQVTAWKGDHDLFCHLLGWGADPCDSGALELAAERAEWKILKTLLEKYRDRYPSIQNGYGSLTLCNAVFYGEDDLLKILLQYRLDATSTVLEPSVIGDGLYLCEYDCSSYGERYSAFGYTIQCPSQHRNKFVEMFLQAKCDPNSIAWSWFPKNKDQLNVGHRLEPALNLAITTKDAILVDLLVRHGAHINRSAIRGIERTPIQQAAEFGSIEIVRYLAKRSAKINASPCRTGGGTALQLAAIGGYTKIVDFLLSHGAEIDAPGSQIKGRKALEGAAEHGRFDVVKALINAGAASRGKDRVQITRAKELAYSRGHDHIREYLDEQLPEQMEMEGVEAPNGDDLMDWEWHDKLAGPS